MMPSAIKSKDASVRGAGAKEKIDGCIVKELGSHENFDRIWRAFFMIGGFKNNFISSKKNILLIKEFKI